MDKDTSICISIAANPGNFGSTFHNSAYKFLGLNWVYLPRKVESVSQLGSVIEGIHALGIRGCSVSMPHKEAIIKYIDELDISAEKIRAINTIQRQEGGALKGYNTDFYGYKKSIEGIDIKEKKIMMVGAGGVARAIAHAIVEEKGQLVIANRTFEKALSLSEELKCDVLPWDQLTDTSGYLFVNATSVGMRSPTSMVVPVEVLARFEVIQDVVIDPVQTLLLREAKKQGKRIIHGIKMCVYQAAEQFNIYTGLDAPSEVIAKALPIYR